MDNYDIHFRWYRGDILCSEVKADSCTHTIEVINYVTDREEKIFGDMKKVTWDYFTYFIEERCVPRTRANIWELLDMMGLHGYDPFAIFKITGGQMASDKCRAEIVRWLDDE